MSNPSRPAPPPGPAEPQAPATEQFPLGSDPSYDDLLDVASQYSFPCSDPPAVEDCSKVARKGPGSTPGHGEPVAQ